MQKELITYLSICTRDVKNTRAETHFRYKTKKKCCVAEHYFEIMDIFIVA